MSKKQFTGKIDFDNGDGTVDEFTYKEGRIVEVRTNIKRRNGKK